MLTLMTGLTTHQQSNKDPNQSKRIITNESKQIITNEYSKLQHD
jgi:hypothetical protein